MNFNTKYQLPAGLDITELKGPLVKTLANESNIKMSENLNDRAVLMYLRGESE